MEEMSWERMLPVSKILIEAESGLFGLGEHLCFGAARSPLLPPLALRKECPPCPILPSQLTSCANT